MNSDRIARLGGWLFSQRSWLPLPIATCLLLIPAEPSVSFSTLPLWSGVLIVASGELLRIWAVHHIGVISRTRSERLGPLIATGPFSLVRNPLYVGNILLWVGFSVSARLLWLVPAVVLLLALQYHAIVRWEERLLESRLGQTYRMYATRVPRWIPSLRGPDGLVSAARFSWRETLFSERGTLIAIAIGYLLLWVKDFIYDLRFGN
jgi:protein-S-isoprenylcysteine O-methyltransferase Ste14